MSRVRLLTVGMLLLALLCACEDKLTCDRCQECPEPACENGLYDGRLYIAMDHGNLGLYVVDTGTDSLVDSIIYQTAAVSVTVSSDGRYVAVGDDQGTVRVYSAAGMSLLATLTGENEPQFVRGDDYLLCSNSGFSLYSVPDFGLVQQDAFTAGKGAHYSSGRHSLYAVGADGILREYSLSDYVVVRQWTPQSSSGKPLELRAFDVSPDDSLLYLIGWDGEWGVYITYDLTGDSLINDHLFWRADGCVRANPMVGDVYAVDPSSSFLYYTPGAVFVFDDKSGEYLEGVSLYGYLPNPRVCLSAWDMEITPDGRQLYVATGHVGRDPGTVVRIDTKSRTLEKVIFPEFYRSPRALAIGPKPGGVRSPRVGR